MGTTSDSPPNPTVSVVIPTKDRPLFLRSAIQSVLEQNYRDYEIIVVDDGTDSKSLEVATSFDDSRIHYITNHRKPGSSGARNCGIELAQGKYVAFLDDDDEWLPEKLRLQVEVLEARGRRVGLVSCGVVFVDSESGVERSRHIPRYRGDVYDRLFDDMTGPYPSAAVVRKSALDICGGFDERLQYADETDLWIRIARQYEFEVVERYVVLMRRTHQNRLTADDVKQIEGFETLLRKYGHDSFSPLWRSGVFVRLGNAFCHIGDRVAGRSYLREAIRLNPRQAKTYVYWFASWLPDWAYSGLRKLKDNAQPLLPKGW